MSDSFAPSHRTCPQCRAEVPEDGTNGLCPACLLEEAMKPTEAKKRWEPPHAEDLAKLLPQYEITRMLGRGGMGAVYQGRQKSLDRAVAIKILSHDLDSADVSFAQRFKNEARAMARLSHPGIVAVYDSGETPDGLLYIVMEFIEGTDVARMMTSNGRLHSGEAMAITAHVCDALSYAHDRGIIHRDIKPANIMIGYDGVVKVADFGLAKMTQEDKAGLTQSGMAMGTLYYMAPEALMLGAGVDHRADIYAVGVMLYQMLTGKLPQGMFELPSMQIPGLDPRYDGIIAKALREDRELRYPNTHDMRHDLDAILTQPVTKVEENAGKVPPALQTHARPQRPGVQSRRPSRPQSPEEPTLILRREKKSSALLWAVLLALAAAAGWWGWEKTTQSKHAATATRAAGSGGAPPAPTLQRRTGPAVGPAPLKPLPKLVSGVWQDLLADGPVNAFTYATGKPENMVPVRGADGSIQGYKATSVVTVTSRQAYKDCVIRMKISGQFFPQYPWIMTRSSGPYSYVGCFLSNNSARWNTHSVTGPDSKSTMLASQSWSKGFHEQPSLEFEVRVEGDQFILSKDGAVLLQAQDKTYASGKIGFRIYEGTVIERFQVMPLDSGTTMSVVSSPPADTSLLSPLSPGSWHDLLRDDLIPLAGLKAEPSKTQPGALSYRAISNTTARSTPLFKDCLLRAKFSGSWTNAPQLIMRRTPTGATRYISATTIDDKAFLRNHSSNGYNVFASAAMGSSLPREQSVELELKAVGDRFTFCRDGKVVVEGSITGYDLGQVGFQMEINTVLESLEIMPLDAATGAAPAAPTKAPASSQTSPPVWIDRTGRQITADFVRLEQDKVVLSINGKESVVALDLLSVESQGQARQLGAAQGLAANVAAAKPAPTMPTAKQPVAGAGAKTGTGAFTNSLGMSFVEVPGMTVQFCTHETRFRDFTAYASAQGSTSMVPWRNQTYGGHALGATAPDHPVVHVTPKNAQDFCAWLSQKEGRTYRLPTDAEWTAAVNARPSTGGGMGTKKSEPRHPWGADWPPPRGAGNYSDESYHRLRPRDPYLPRHDDGFPTTAPVGTYPANAAGLHDLGGNVWEWVSMPATVNREGQPVENFALRGASFLHSDQAFLLTSKRLEDPLSSEADRGFRIVLEK